MFKSVIGIIFFVVIGSISMLIDKMGFSSFSLSMLWLSIIGGLICVIWFPFEFVSSVIAKEREREYQQNLNQEQNKEQNEDQNEKQKND